MNCAIFVTRRYCKCYKPAAGTDSCREFFKAANIWTVAVASGGFTEMVQNITIVINFAAN